MSNIKTITIKDTTFSGKERTRQFDQEDYVRQWTESAGVVNLYYLERTSSGSKVFEDDRTKVKTILKLIEEMAINRFKELLKEEEEEKEAI
tara:strand:- start:39 stop:311 length:273 start_codon:yes stop_codon:yes gene_type:complete